MSNISVVHHPAFTDFLSKMTEPEVDTSGSNKAAFAPIVDAAEESQRLAASVADLWQSLDDNLLARQTALSGAATGKGKSNLQAWQESQFALSTLPIRIRDTVAAGVVADLVFVSRVAEAATEAARQYAAKLDPVNSEWGTIRRQLVIAESVPAPAEDREARSKPIREELARVARTATPIRHLYDLAAQTASIADAWTETRFGFRICPETRVYTGYVPLGGEGGFQQAANKRAAAAYNHAISRVKAAESAPLTMPAEARTLLAA
jgi:hypothetical protein